MPTIKEIARLAEVSRGTVDRVLNNRGSVNAETERRIRELAKAMNYTPNRAGKSLAIRKKQLKLGFILFSSTAVNPFFLDVVAGIDDRRKTFSEFGTSVDVRYATIHNPSLQVQLIDELLDSGIDGLALTPINHPLVWERITQLIGKGFPVVTSNSDLPDCGRLAYVGSNYFKSGETAAGLLNQCTAGQPTNVGIIQGSPWVLCHSERVAGFEKQIRCCYPQVQIIGTEINEDDDLNSYIVTREMLSAHPEINALYLVAGGVQGACRAVNDLRKEQRPRIISHDVTAATRSLLEDGTIAFSIAQQPFYQGSKPLDILFDYLVMNQKPEKEFYYTNIEIVVRENL